MYLIYMYNNANKQFIFFAKLLIKICETFKNASPNLHVLHLRGGLEIPTRGTLVENLKFFHA